MSTSSPCQLEAVLPNRLASRTAEISFRANESLFLAPACLEQTTGMLLLNPQFRAHLHLGRDFAFSIFLFFFFYGRSNACQMRSFISSGGFTDKLCRLASLAVHNAVCMCPHASSPFLMPYLLCGCPLITH